MLSVALVILGQLAGPIFPTAGKTHGPWDYSTAGGTGPVLAQPEYAFFEFAPASGAGMGTACACTPVSGIYDGEFIPITVARASTGICTKGNTTSGIQNGDLVDCSSGQPRVMPGCDGTDGLGLLVGESRTNTLFYSESLATAPWRSDVGGGASVPTVTANTIISPRADATADTVSFPATSASQWSLWAQSNACTSSTSNVLSVYVKGVSGSGVIDVVTYTGTYQGIACAYNDATWTRCKTPALVPNVPHVFIGNASSLLAGTPTRPAQSVYVWGAQCEVGLTASSYIVTTATAAQRADETANVAIAGAPAGLTTAAEPPNWVSWDGGTVVLGVSNGVGKRVCLGVAGSCTQGAPPACVNTAYPMSSVDTDWGIETRDGAGLVTLANGHLVLTGGWNGGAPAGWGSNPTTNQVFKSVNGGVTFTVVLAHDDAPPQTGAGQRWRRRHSHGSIVATVGGTEYVYVIGGDMLDTGYYGAGVYPADVWRSADEGATWTRMVTGAPWGNRMLHMVWAMGSTLYIAGGQSDINTRTSVLNDVWKSEDGGATWTSLGNAPWTGRGAVIQPPTLNGKVWMAGGEQYDPTDRVYFNDVWTFDGASWVQVAASSPWAVRGYVNTVVLDRRLWVLRGTNSGGNLSDAWYSSDGVNWTQNSASFPIAEHAASAAVSSDGLRIITCGGMSDSPRVRAITAVRDYE